jgi:hypothetical protein
MVDDAQMVRGWQQTVEAAHQQLTDLALPALPADLALPAPPADLALPALPADLALPAPPGSAGAGADVAEMAAGAGSIFLGLGGEIGGLALDATGIGAALGLPAAVVSAGAIAGGLTSFAAGAHGLAQDNGSDLIGPMQVNTFGRAKPDDDFIQEQRERARQEQRAHDHVETTGELPKEREIPKLFGGWGKSK